MGKILTKKENKQISKFLRILFLAKRDLKGHLLQPSHFTTDKTKDPER
jgi:hypothetical protein